ncbi:RNA pyrophosphohydrolase [Pelagovum pacificum]|uniref:RNA pyrophosphohydrolase n=1 Tax=Pelagovum pacificum TaxID=2588711 RepID=A0A5C5GK75_9RHOB|nr:RNA pyrophosphohydrolase [Pelagovum pacificum]QQA42638.1 RNA pyrophosphohydrolase [Pelagovum pacificum]TNY34211.1 RNA pyrophosphohydrolase [Pelagovum pacificum]
MTDQPVDESLYRPCVGVVLANRNGEVFVGQRIESDQPAWQMPQGGIDDGETALQAGLRELWEETGVTADLVRIEAETEGWLIYDFPDDIAKTRWKGRFKGQRQKWLLARFTGEDDAVNISTAHPEFSEWKWVTPLQALEAIVPFKRDVYERMLREFDGRI